MSSSSYALTASFSSISTDQKARSCFSLADGIDKAMANLRYIARNSATDHQRGGVLFYRTNGITEGFPKDRQERRKLFSLCKTMLEKRGKKHTQKTGVRLLDKCYLSLPADANRQQQLETAKLIVEDIASDSEAFVLAAIHIDKPQNPHMHLWMLDGLETLEHAKSRTKKRTPDDKTGPRCKKKRVRRRDYIRLGELHSRKNARLKCAALINAIAERDNLRRAEPRSLKDQGIVRKPQSHEGPGLAQKRKPRSDGEYNSRSDKRAWIRANENLRIIAAQKYGATALAFPQDWIKFDASVFPARLRCVLTVVTEIMKNGTSNREAPIPQAQPSLTAQISNDTDGVEVPIVKKAGIAQSNPVASSSQGSAAVSRNTNLGDQIPGIQDHIRKWKKERELPTPQESFSQKLTHFGRNLLPIGDSILQTTNDVFQKATDVFFQIKLKSQKARAKKRKQKRIEAFHTPNPVASPPNPVTENLSQTADSEVSTQFVGNMNKPVRDGQELDDLQLRAISAMLEEPAQSMGRVLRIERDEQYDVDWDEPMDLDEPMDWDVQLDLDADSPIQETPTVPSTCALSPKEAPRKTFQTLEGRPSRSVASVARAKTESMSRGPVQRAPKPSPTADRPMVDLQNQTANSQSKHPPKKRNKRRLRDDDLSL